MIYMDILPVPLIRQAEESSDCGPACLAMILEFHGVLFDFEEMKRSLGVYQWGTVTPQLGTYLLKNGFAVEIVTMHPALFSLHMKFGDDTQLLRGHLKGLRGKMKGEFDDIALDHFLAFLDAGGVLTPRIPTLKDIEEEMRHQRPVLVPVTHWFLHESDLPPRFSIHFNVITGIDNESVAVNDPDWGDEFGGAHVIDRDAFLFAMYASAKGGIDDACVMKIRKL